MGSRPFIITVKEKGMSYRKLFLVGVGLIAVWHITPVIIALFGAVVAGILAGFSG